MTNLHAFKYIDMISHDMGNKGEAIKGDSLNILNDKLLDLADKKSLQLKCDSDNNKREDNIVTIFDTL